MHSLARNNFIETSLKVELKSKLSRWLLFNWNNRTEQFQNTQYVPKSIALITKLPWQRKPYHVRQPKSRALALSSLKSQSLGALDVKMCFWNKASFHEDTYLVDQILQNLNKIKNLLYWRYTSLTKSVLVFLHKFQQKLICRKIFITEVVLNLKIMGL